MEDWHGMIEADQDFDFQEDVWGREREESNHHKVYNYNKMKKKTSSSSYSDGARMIPRQQQQSSAPMSIPDCSKIYKEKSQSKGDEDDEDDGGKIVPPHEYIARRSRHITPSSMCEGVGRTLKGRDLSKLRNAILTKTGFLELN